MKICKRSISQPPVRMGGLRVAGVDAGMGAAYVYFWDGGAVVMRGYNC